MTMIHEDNNYIIIIILVTAISSAEIIKKMVPWRLLNTNKRNKYIKDVDADIKKEKTRTTTTTKILLWRLNKSQPFEMITK